MKVANLNAAARTSRGSNANFQLRKNGRIPAVIYGLGSTNETVSLDADEFQTHIRHHHRVFRIDVGGKEEAAYMQSVQWDCLTDEPLHVDFLRIDLTKPMHLVVGATFIGHPNGLSKGGQLIRDHQEISILALPDAVPDQIEINVDALELDERILAKELTLPAGVTLDMPGDTVICHVALIRLQEVAPAAAEAVVEAPAGEAAKAEGDAKPKSDAKPKGDAKPK